MRADAWDVDIFHLEKFNAVNEAHSMRIIEEGPLRAMVEFEFRISDKSWIKQRVSLDAASALLDFDTEVEWQGKDIFLKTEFPLTVPAPHAAYEVQFGYLERPTHFNTSWDIAKFEVCGHRWSDLSEADYGVALFTDSKYGYSTFDNTLRLSLLRAPKLPDPFADMGRHRFSYALFPHAGSHQDADVTATAHAYNSPLLLSTSESPLETTQWFELSRAGVVFGCSGKSRRL